MTPEKLRALAQNKLVIRSSLASAVETPTLFQAKIVLVHWDRKGGFTIATYEDECMTPTQSHIPQSLSTSVERGDEAAQRMLSAWVGTPFMSEEQEIASLVNHAGTQRVPINHFELMSHYARFELLLVEECRTRGHFPQKIHYRFWTFLCAQKASWSDMSKVFRL